MPAILWDDVPDAEQDRRACWTWRGCPYAARGYWRDDGYHRCGLHVPAGATACRVHDPTLASRRPDQVLAMVRARARSMEVLSHEGRHTTGLQWFRSLTDRDVGAWPWAGAKMIAKAREIRETWTDDRILAFFDFPERRPPGPRPPGPSWYPTGCPYWLMGG